MFLSVKSCFKKSTKSGRLYLLIIGILFHIACLTSIFDIYFTSPLTGDVEPIKNPLPPPAKRLVFFVGDGLRADKVFKLKENRTSLTPYLHQIIKNKGFWGVSHTHVPTESRPGHVAMIAGFYEDVSAVTRGWKENPVEFDHVFNRSRRTWSWGSPDVVPLFTKGKSLEDGHVSAFTYPSEVEDFGGSKDAKLLDEWVFENAKKFFYEANETEKALLWSDKVVFFLHLLGTDTNGHAHLPSSFEYEENIRYVDSMIQNFTSFINDYYSDNQTVYIFTSDHGMSDRGAHGGGHPDETRTPLICWGAGIRGPDLADYRKIDNLFPASNYFDIEQADLAPLMATLLGLEIPINSVGKLPHVYLSTTNEFKARSMRANALQLIRSVKKIEEKKMHASLFFRPFRPLKKDKLRKISRLLDELIEKENWLSVIDSCSQLIDLSRVALRYYQTYDRYYLQCMFVLSYTAWLCLISMFIIYNYTPVFQHVKGTSIGEYKKYFPLFIAALLFSSAVLYFTHQECRFYLYSAFTIAFWYGLVSNKAIIYYTFWYLWKNRLSLGVLVRVSLLLVGLELLVLSFFQRRLLSAIILFIGASTLLRKDLQFFKKSQSTAFLWSLYCFVLAVFPFFSVEKKLSLIMIVCSTVFLAAFSYYVYTTKFCSEPLITRGILLFQIFFLLLTSIVHCHSSLSLSARKGLPYPNMLFSWISLMISFIPPLLLHPNKINLRYISCTLSFGAPYILLCLSYESIFYAFLVPFMHCWVELETILYKLRNHNPEIFDSKLKKRFTWEDVRIAYYYLFFLIFSAFSIGNVASISSFDLSSCYRFLTVFSPFTMSALMIFKIFVPLLIVSGAFSIICTSIIKVETTSFFLVTVALSDVMAVNFFFLVKDEGSWLKIGESISHFVINSAVIIGLPIFNLLACWLLGTRKERLKRPAWNENNNKHD